MNTPSAVVSVTRPDHSLNRAGSPKPLPQMRKLSIRNVTDRLAGREAGTIVVGCVLWNPISEVTVAFTIATTAVADVMSTGFPVGLKASTRIVNGRWTSSEPFRQASTGVP